MMVLWISLVVITLLIVGYFWKYHPIHLSVVEILQNVAHQLHIKDFALRKYPIPLLQGIYFGYRFSLEGGGRKKGYRFRARIELPKSLSFRIFLSHEQRKTSFKPISQLNWIPTGIQKFDDSFLLLSNDEKRAKNVFQSYLCEKILTVSETNWQMDVSGTEAHFEVWKEFLNPTVLAELISVVIECLNALTVSES